MAKVKIQGHASGTGILTVTAPNTSTDRTITLPDEDVTLGAATPSIDDNGNATAITIDSSENVGIGVTPESWDGNTPALQLGKGGSLATHANNPTKVMLSGNFYSNSSGTDSYIETNEASQFFQEEGAFQFRVAPSGTADAAISWTEAMNINNDGIVTKPKQPAFKVGLTTSQNFGGNNIIEFDTTDSPRFNDGNHYSTSTGKFTAPVAGVYQFSASVVFQNVSNNTSMTDIVKMDVNSTQVAYSIRRGYYVESYTGAGGYYVDYIDATLKLAANDYVVIKQKNSGTIHGNANYTVYQGHLIG
jgi:hypothetical protein